MKILALEFSSIARSAAAGRSANWAAGEFDLLGEASQTRERGLAPMALIEQALEAARLRPADIEAIVVGLGPGSYAGIRIALAIAQGWALIRSTPVCGYSSFEAVAAQAAAEFTGKVMVAANAQRNEFYCQPFFLGPPGRRRAAAPLALQPAAAVAAVAGDAPLIGPELSAAFPGARDVFPTAKALGQAAAGRAAFGPSETIEPIYLRPVSFVKAPATRAIG